MSAVPVPAALLIAALRAHAPLTAKVAANQIATQLHGTYPAIRVTQVGGPPRLVTNTSQPILQYEVWGTDSSPDAEWAAAQAAQVIEAAVEDGALVGTYAGVGTAAAFWNESTPASVPDAETLRARYLGTVGLLGQP